MDYRGRQYIIKIKIWRGGEYNRRGEAQPASYLESYHAQKGYMLSFNFNKKKEKEREPYHAAGIPALFGKVLLKTHKRNHLKIYKLML